MKTEAPFRRPTNGAIRNGRNVSEGYARGWGLEFSDLRDQIRLDPLYQDASALAQNRSVVSEDKRINIFLLLKYFLSNLPFGHIVEFGSYRGGQAMFMARVAQALLPGVRVYGLDTFTGLPAADAEIDLHLAGDFRGVDLVELRSFCSTHRLDNLEFIPGLFDETAPALLSSLASVRLAHIDCDLRSSCAYAYDVVKPYMVTGGYYIFDDAAVSSCMGATEAVEEILIRRDRLCTEQTYPHFVFRHGLEDRSA